MFQLPTLTAPMGSTALQAAAEALTRQSGALTDLARALAAYEAATGLSVAVVDASAKLVSGPDETVPQRLPPSVDAPLPLDQAAAMRAMPPLDAAMEAIIGPPAAKPTAYNLNRPGFTGEFVVQ